MPNQLFPVFNVPWTLAVENEQHASRKYLPAPMWDGETGDFVTDGAGKLLYGNGKDAWVLWCTKAIMTQRLAHLGYNANEGIEAEEAFKEPDRKAVESALERTITEALLADPLGRTIQVRNFLFEWEADSLWIECVAVGTEGDTASVKAKLNR